MNFGGRKNLECYSWSPVVAGLVGSFPSSVSNLTQLQTFNIGVNTGVNASSLLNLSLPSTLTKYCVNQVGLTSLMPNQFSNFTNLQHLDLSNNQISSLSPNQFSGLNNLQTLNLNINQISSLSPDQFAGLNNLLNLSIDNNQLSSLSTDQFSGLTYLQNLGLSNNQFSSLNPNRFSNLHNLQSLYLGGNQISSLNPNQFAGLNNLLNLIIGDNQLSSLSTNQFSGLNNLQYLHLSSNQISSFSPNQFAGLTNLQNLALSNNQLSSLSTNQFAGLTNLQNLALSNNQLSSLSTNQFSGLTNLYHLFISSLGYENSFIGAIPAAYSGFNFTTNPTWSRYLEVHGNNVVCGQMPAWVQTAWNQYFSGNTDRTDLDNFTLFGGQIPVDLCPEDASCNTSADCISGLSYSSSGNPSGIYTCQGGGGGGSNQAPTVTLTSPSQGQTYTAPASITLGATASDSDGTVTQVQFYNGGSLLNTDTSAPYAYTRSNVTAGNYTLTAVATDNDNATTTSTSVTITVEMDDPGGGGNNGNQCYTDAIAYRPFNETTGTIIHDQIGNNHGSGVNIERSNLCVEGSCISFSGNNNYISIPHSNTLNLTGARSIELRSKPNIFNGFQALYSKNVSPRPASIWLSNDKVEVRYDPAGPALQSNGSILLNNRNHIVATFYQGNLKIYINGQFDSEATVSNPEINSLDITFGQRGDNSFYYSGYLDNIAVFNRQLTSGEISDHYNQTCSAGGNACTNGATNFPECNYCNAGDYRNGTSCISCPAGSYCTGGLENNALTCPANHYCPAGSTTPTACPSGTTSPAGSQNSNQCTIPSGPDSDNDGIPDNQEQSTPNNGDGNFDGIADDAQSTVRTYATPTAGVQATIALSGLNSCQGVITTQVQPENQGPNDNEYVYPYGLNHLTIGCPQATVQIYYHGATTLPSTLYRKYVGSTWTSFPITQGVTSNVPYISFTLTDGGSGDSDGIVNGTIQDPGGIALPQPPSNGSSTKISSITCDTLDCSPSSVQEHNSADTAGEGALQQQETQSSQESSPTNETKSLTPEEYLTTTLQQAINTVYTFCGKNIGKERINSLQQLKQQKQVDPETILDTYCLTDGASEDRQETMPISKGEVIKMIVDIIIHNPDQISLVAKKNTVLPYNDIKPGHPYRSYIQAAHVLGLLDGVTDTKSIKALGPISPEQLQVLLTNVATLYETPKDHGVADNTTSSLLQNNRKAVAHLVVDSFDHIFQGSSYLIGNNGAYLASFLKELHNLDISSPVEQQAYINQKIYTLQNVDADTYHKKYNIDTDIIIQLLQQAIQ